MYPRPIFLAAIFLFVGNLSAVEKTRGPVRVKIEEQKPELAEPVLPIEAGRRVEFQLQAGMSVRITSENKILHLGNIWTSLKIDDQVQHQGPWRLEAQSVPLPKTASGKERDGSYSVYTAGKLRITQSVEAVPGTKPGQKKRLLDTALVRYTIENKDTIPHRVGMRKSMDVFIVDNDGALFAAPNQPGRVLDGVEIGAAKMMPDYLQFLQNADLQNPGYVAHMTFSLGSMVEKPNRIVLTSLGAASPDNWNMQAIPADGDSAMHMYWDPKEIKPNGRRQLAFAFGGSIAAHVENEGNVKIDLAGSFEPGKRFTINAYVSDPAPAQELTLELPPNMELVQGQETQPVPPRNNDDLSLVQWQAGVLRTGNTTLRIRSSTGVVYSTKITITPADSR